MALDIHEMERYCALIAPLQKREHQSNRVYSLRVCAPLYAVVLFLILTMISTQSVVQAQGDTHYYQSDNSRETSLRSPNGGQRALDSAGNRIPAQQGFRGGNVPQERYFSASPDTIRPWGALPDRQASSFNQWNHPSERLPPSWDKQTFHERQAPHRSERYSAAPSYDTPPSRYGVDPYYERGYDRFGYSEPTGSSRYNRNASRPYDKDYHGASPYPADPFWRDQNRDNASPYAHNSAAHIEYPQQRSEGWSNWRDRGLPPNSDRPSYRYRPNHWSSSPEERYRGYSDSPYDRYPPNYGEYNYGNR